jgi:hypothetical protein
MTDLEIKNIILKTNPSIDEVKILINEYLSRVKATETFDTFIQGPITLPWNLQAINQMYSATLEYFTYRAGITITRVFDKNNNFLFQF